MANDTMTKIVEILLKVESNTSALKDTNAQLGKLKQNTEDSEKSLKSLAGNIKTAWQAAATAMAAVGIKSIFKDLIDGAIQMEQTTRRLGVALGSMAQGAKALDGLQKAAQEAGKSIRDTEEAGVKLAQVMGSKGPEAVVAYSKAAIAISTQMGTSVKDVAEQIDRLLLNGPKASKEFSRTGILALLGFTKGIDYSLGETQKKWDDFANDVGGNMTKLTAEFGTGLEANINRLGNTWDQFKEGILKSGLFEFMVANVRVLAGEMDKATESTGTLGSKAKDASNAISTGFKYAALTIGFLGDVILFPMGLINGLIAALAKLGQGITWVVRMGVVGFKYFELAILGVNRVLISLWGKFQDFIGWVVEKFAGLLDTMGSALDVLPAALIPESWVSGIKSAAKSMDDFSKGIKDNTATMITGIDAQIEAKNKDIETTKNQKFYMEDFFDAFADKEAGLAASQTTFSTTRGLMEYFDNVAAEQDKIQKKTQEANKELEKQREAVKGIGEEVVKTQSLWDRALQGRKTDQDAKRLAAEKETNDKVYAEYQKLKTKMSAEDDKFFKAFDDGTGKIQADWSKVEMNQLDDLLLKMGKSKEEVNKWMVENAAAYGATASQVKDLTKSLGMFDEAKYQAQYDTYYSIISSFIGKTKTLWGTIDPAAQIAKQMVDIHLSVDKEIADYGDMIERLKKEIAKESPTAAGVISKKQAEAEIKAEEELYKDAYTENLLRTDEFWKKRKDLEYAQLNAEKTQLETQLKDLAASGEDYEKLVENLLKLEVNARRREFQETKSIIDQKTALFEYAKKRQQELETMPKLEEQGFAASPSTDYEQQAISAAVSTAEAQRDARLAVLQNEIDQGLILTADGEARKAEIIAQSEAQITAMRMKSLQLWLDRAKSTADMMEDAFGNLYEATGKKIKAFFYLQKAAAIASTIISTYEGAQKAYTSLAGIPYVGPALGLVAAAIAVAGGIARIAIISSQNLAKGGPVKGHSPTPTADNIPANLTAGEFVQPVSSVSYYGPGVMEGLRRQIIPRALFSNVSALEAKRGSAHFASGGLVIPTQQQKPDDKKQEVNIVNITTADQLDQYLATKPGEDRILNIINRYNRQVKAILQQ